MSIDPAPLHPSQPAAVTDVELLLVEDNPDDGDLVLRVLAKGKVANQIFWVTDGAAALDFLLARNAYADRIDESLPRLVLLDLKLPKVSGLEVLRAIRHDDRLRSLPVVVLTSSALGHDMVESYRLGVNSYITKPVTYAEFQRVIQEIGLYWLVVNQVPQASHLFSAPRGL